MDKSSGSKPAGVEPLISLKRPDQAGLLAALMNHAAAPLEKALALDLVNTMYAHGVGALTPVDFIARLLDHLQISFSVPQEQLDLIPKTGPLMVVANHPFGAIEGLILASTLLQVRPDVKIPANHLLGRIAELRDLFFLVNVLADDHSSRNRTPMRQTLTHLRNGGALGLFPAGEVAHLTWAGQISEMPWTSHLARLVKIGKCPVVPIYFRGHNSMLFQIAGLCHPRIRTALLVREMFKLRGMRIDLQIGSPVPFARLNRMKDDQQLVNYLRTRTLSLGMRETSSEKRQSRPSHKPQVEIIAPLPPFLLEAEVRSLDARQILVDSDDMATYIAEAHQIPHTLREIGRLREITFRQTGEGTGRELDVDQYDQYYHHLFIWHKTLHQIVGGYRIGMSEQILRKHGVKGFYTQSLFRFDQELLQTLGTPALELGRSFVCDQYQKSFAPLLMLWKGIGQVIARNPSYCHLIGPVSISAQYQSVSREMMVDFLNCHFADPQLNSLVKPRRAFRSRLRIPFIRKSNSHLPSDPEHFSALVSDIEDDGKGIPVLLRQYLRMGARVVSFNLDPDFSDVLDALLVVDLRQTDLKLLERYMGPSATDYLAMHKSTNPVSEPIR